MSKLHRWAEDDAIDRSWLTCTKCGIKKHIVKRERFVSTEYVDRDGVVYLRAPECDNSLVVPSAILPDNQLKLDL